MAHLTIAPRVLDDLLAEQPIDSYQLEDTTDTQFIGLLANIERDALSQLMREQRYERGDIVCREGDVGDSIYLIWAGRVAVCKGDLDVPILLGYRGPGEVIGEMALLENDVRSASIIAIEPVRILLIGRDEFLNFIKDKPQIQHNIMVTLSHRLRGADVDRQRNAQLETRLAEQINHLQSEKEQLLALQRVRQETSDLIIHDLRNPLNLMSSAIQMLEIMLPDEIIAQNRELLDIANHAYRRMSRLIESLLDVAKMENDEVELKLAEFDLVQMVRDIVQQSKFSLEKRNIVVVWQVADGLPLATADEEKIGRVIANLVDNALKYMPSGGTLTLTVRQQEAAMLVCIADTGPGVPEKDRQRIFERFAQVEDEHHKRHGFGLGLAFCHLAVTAHQGRIWVEAGDGGQGSRFCFTLPLSF